MNIYLDIDGVLLTKNGRPAPGLKEFLEQIVGRHSCYWLTTHCRGGADRSLEIFENKVSSIVLELIKHIRPTNWKTLKTEAIDFSQDFRWFDDYVMKVELEVLKEKGVLDKLILVDLSKNDLVEYIHQSGLVL